MCSEAWDETALKIEGAWRLPGAGAGALPELQCLSEKLPQERAGIRLSGEESLRPLLAADGPIGGVAARALGASCQPVRAIMFDKTRDANWSLGWHQDRTICVRERIDVQGFGPWTVKQGLVHVAPPFELIARMVTLRVHLDDVPDDNAPLLIAPGSHLFGHVPEPMISEIVGRCGVRTCTAVKGDIWIYATPILHASGAAMASDHRRRVLQVDYSRDALPGALQWLGI